MVEIVVEIRLQVDADAQAKARGIRITEHFAGPLLEDLRDPMRWQHAVDGYSHVKAVTAQLDLGITIPPGWDKV